MTPRTAKRTALALCALLLSFCLAAFAQADDSRAIFREIDQTLHELSEITGLTLHKPVPADLISKDKVNQFLKKKVKEVASPAELRAEELTLKKFGLVPADFDLAKTTVDVLTEQAAAFYDYRAKKLSITDWTPSTAREAALAHELAHALADQYFNLGRFIRQARKSDDESLARMAVMEGQASWIMSEFLARKMGQSLVNNPGLLDAMSRMSDSAGGQFPAFDGAPLYIQLTLVFPYTKGMLFQQAVLTKLGKDGFAEVFRHPPVSTQQVLHPEMYFAGEKPDAPDLPQPASTHGYKDLIEGSFGELDHQILLRQYLGAETAEALAPHWRGGRYLLRENRKKHRVILEFACRWDTLPAARDFFAAYRQVLAKKFHKLDVRSESPAAIKGTADDGDFLLRLEGTVVTSLEGLEPTEPAPSARP